MNLFNTLELDFSPTLKKILSIMKLTVVLLILFSLNISATVYSQTTKLSLNVQNQSIKDVLYLIENQSDFRFIYESGKINLDRVVSICVNNQTVDVILKLIFDRVGVRYEITENNLILINPIDIDNVSNNKFSQDERRLTGIVRDKNGEPVIGANVTVKDLTVIGTVTDLEGKFALVVDKKAKVLSISYIGYVTQEIEIKGQRTFDIILQEDALSLDELVVVGYGKQKKVNLTGSVSSVDFEKESVSSRPLTNVSTALTGMSSGLFISQSSGTPGADAATIKVRGTGSLNTSSNPLVIIDGQPGDMNLISPNDIASVSILKDAASSAIYGSRASNGVILITTKSGEDTNGKVAFSYSGNIGFSKPTRLYDIISNTADHMIVVNQIEKNSNRTPSFSDDLISEWREKSKTDPILYPNTNWWDAILKDNTLQTHSLSARGGNDKIGFYTSFNYLGNDGLMDNTAYSRFTFRNSLTYQVNKWLKLGNNLTALFGNQDPASTDAVFQWFIATTPGLLPRHPDGRYGGGMTGETAANNPLRTLETARGEKKTQSYAGKIFATITPFSGLEITGSYFLDMINYNAWGATEPTNTYNFQTGDIIQPATTSVNISNSYQKTRREVIDVFGTYSKTFGRHSGSLLLGFNQEYYKLTKFSASKRDLYSLDTPVLDAAATNVSSGGNMGDYAMRSWFGRLNYDYANRYLFEANLRVDGSSRFAPDNRWGVFPSFSAGWRISEEMFWNNLKNTVDNLKFRLSWGQLGNNGIGNYDWQNVYSPGNYSFNGAIVKGIMPTSIANNQITWETTDVLDIGIDVTLFNRLSLTLDYYDKYTHGILASLPIPYVNGGLTSPKVNSAKVRNKGFEFDLNYRNTFGPVEVSLGVNGTINKNVIEKYKGDLLEAHGQGVWTEGMPIGKYWVREIDHIVQDQGEIDALLAQGWTFSPSTPGPGDFLYKDQNGDKKINDDDRILKGNPIPVFTYGGNISLNYKDFDFYMLVNGVLGWDRYTSSQFFSLNQYVQGYLYPTYLLNQWTDENHNTTIPKVYVSNAKNQQQSDYHLHSADYLRIKTLQLGYTVPSLLTKKIGIDKLRVYVNMENFFTFTSYPGMDPETTGSSSNADTTYPLMKTISVGLNVNF